MKYDVVVIGGGSRGRWWPARLSEDPNLSILLLEAGPDYPRSREPAGRHPPRPYTDG